YMTDVFPRHALWQPCVPGQTVKCAMGSLFTTDPALSKLAELAGLVEHWQDVHGQEHQVPPSTLRLLLNTLDLPSGSLSQIRESQRRLEYESPGRTDHMILVDAGARPIFRRHGSLGYTLTLENGEQSSGTATRIGSDLAGIAPIAVAGYHMLAIGDDQLSLTVVPWRCPSMSDLTGKARPRMWGIAAQLYSLRRTCRSTAPEIAPRSKATAPPSILADLRAAGDYSALAQLAHQAAAQGADAVAISPVHAMFSADPGRYSPYAPSSRLFLNTAYIDPAIVFGNDAIESALASLICNESRASSDDAKIDWSRVMRARMQLLRHLFEQFIARAPRPHARAFQTFRQKGGEALESHSRYEALHAHYLSTLGPANGWQEWPAELHDPAGSAVRAYAAEHGKEVSFHAFLQWLADEGMRFAQQSTRQAGMAIGLIADLAIGTDPRGSHAWSRQGDILNHVSVGAAPDLYQPKGQNWGLTAFSPWALRQNAYASFIETVRAALAHAGGLRVDHILGLARMWLVPQGAAASEGVYLHYPLEDMLRLLVLEAWRHNALIIGENLGTTPPGFNQRLAQKGIFGTSVLWFEREAAMADKQDVAAFSLPKSWPPGAVATSTTHDLPTVAGWWSGRDLQWRKQTGQITESELIGLTQERGRDKTALWRALYQAGCVTVEVLAPPVCTPREAILSFVASAPTPLVMIPLEDLLGLAEQPNLPGADGPTPPFHPNWLQRLPDSVENLFKDPGVRGCAAAVARAREAA
ncbi:MAG: 4-alpha-glucanotransferase, partial [Burkholderiaceae bacterium]